MAHDAKISFGNNLAAYFDLFIKQPDSAWQHKKTGYLLPLSKRDGLKELGIIPFVVRPGQELVVYQRKQFDFRIWDPKTISVYISVKTTRDDFLSTYETIYTSSLWDAVFFGVGILAVVFCFFFFLATHERVYFHAAVMNLSLAFFFYIIPSKYTIFRENPWIVEYGQELVITSFLYFVTSTFRFALDTKNAFPLLDKILFVLGLLPSLITVFIFVYPDVLFGFEPVVPAIAGLTFLCIFITCLLAIRKKNKTSKLLIAGVLLMCFYNIYNLLEHLSIISLPGWLLNLDEYIEAIANLWLVITSTWIMFERYRNLQKKVLQEAFEKEQLAKEKEMERRQLIDSKKLNLKNK